MKVILIEPKAPSLHFFSAIKIPRLGLPLLGRILKDKGHEVRIYCEDIQPINWPDTLTADLVGISTITSTTPKGYKIAQTVREHNIKTVMGGTHVTYLPEEALEKVDFVARGEAEETLPELVDWLGAEHDYQALRGIKGLSYKIGGDVIHNAARPLIENLDALPFPDLTLIQGAEKISSIILQTSRGCPFNCKFCLVTKFCGRTYRFRSTESVMRELEQLCQQKPRATVFFYDDNFFAKLSRTKALLEEMLKRGITPRWSAQVRPSDIAGLARSIEQGRAKRLANFFDLMQKTNCYYLYLGAESISQATQEEYRKQQKVEDIEKANEVIRQLGILGHWMFVLGADTDSLSMVLETAIYSIKKKLDTIQMAILTPLPGTDTYQELDSQGRIFSKDWSEYNGMRVVFRPKQMSPWQLQIAVMLKALPLFYSKGNAFRKAFREFFVGLGGTIFSLRPSLSIKARWKRALNSGRKTIVQVKIGIGAAQLLKRWHKQEKPFLERLRHRK